MNNNESHSGGNKPSGEADNRDRFAYPDEPGDNAEQTENASSAAGGDNGEHEASRQTESEAAASAEALTAPASMHAASPEGKKGALGWIVLSAVLAAAVIFLLVKPALGGGDDNVLATVNGAKITKEDVYELLAKHNGEAALDNLITAELVKQEIEAKGISFSDADITAEIDALKLNYGSDETFEMVMQQYNVTMDDLREDMRLSAMVRKALESQADVTDDEIKQYFEDNKAMMGGTPEQVRASHILVETKEEADAIKSELDAGADFAELAKEKSTDGSAANGGDLDFFAREDMVQEFSDAAFALEVGQVSDVVQSKFGYHIIKKTDYKPAVEADFEAKKEAIRVLLVGQEIGSLSDAWMSDIREKASITNKLTEAKEAEAAQKAADESAGNGQAAQ